MSKKLTGNIINLILFIGYGVFCWYFCYSNPEYADLNVFLGILIFLGIFIAARMAVAIFHQIGHAIFAAAAGFKISYFEACFFKFWHDGQRLRFGFFFEPSLLFSGNVMIKLNGSFDTAEGFKKNMPKYQMFLLGGFIFNVSLVALCIIVYVLCLSLPGLSVFSPLFLAALSIMLASWFMIYNAFSEELARRGDFITYTKSRDAENFIVTLAAQSIVEKMDHSFLFSEAQRVTAFKMENGLDWMDRYSMNMISAAAFYACAGQGTLIPEIENYLNNKLFTKEYAENMTRDQKILLTVKIKNFIAYYAINYGRIKALEILNIVTDIFTEMRLKNNELLIYLSDTKEMFKEALDKDELDTLSYTKFLAADSYAMGFVNYKEVYELAEDNVHQAVYNWQPSEE